MGRCTPSHRPPEVERFVARPSPAGRETAAARTVFDAGPGARLREKSRRALSAQPRGEPRVSVLPSTDQNNSMRSISIVLCTFNGARFLDEQLRSLRCQEGVDEIVAVDDQSADDTMAVLNQHASEEARMRVHWNERRLGVVRNFEQAIRLARGDWIALSDQDDIWVPEKIARLRAAWDGVSCLMHHATRKFRGTPPRVLPARAGESRKYHGDDARRLLYRNSIVGHTTLVRADVARRLLPFPEAVPHDWWIGAGAALQGPVHYVDEYLVHYRIHETNAYHRAGSRLHRLRAEHRLRLALLEGLDARPELAGGLRPFVRDYRDLLRAAAPGRFSWSLERFYWRHAALFFGDGGASPPLVRRLRKTAAATLAAAAQRPGVPASGGGVFGELAARPRGVARSC